MAVNTNTAPAAELEFTLEERWVIHAVLLGYAEVAVREDTELPVPTVELSLLERIEDGEYAFTAFELDRIRYECLHHVESGYAGERDRAVTRSIVERIDRQCRVGIGR